VARHAAIFHQRAQATGLDLRADVAVAWLTRNGHLSPEVRDKLPAETRDTLDRILDALDGDAVALAAKTRGSSRVDFILNPRGIVVEYDEVQHFTTARLEALSLYPATALLGFDLAEYIALVRRWSPRGDKGFAHKTAAEFPGPAGRQRQRAYFDAVRDLVAPHFGNGPLIRIASPDNDYDRAVARLRSAV
jgi:hypothetical protein